MAEPGSGAVRTVAGGAAVRPPSLWGRFADTANTVPTAPALRDPHTAYAYAEVLRRCVRLANELRANGVVPGEPVLLCADRTVQAIIAILAISAAGATLVPVEPDGPRPWSEHIVAVSAARVALVDDAGLAAVRSTGVTSLFIEELTAVQERPDRPLSEPPSTAYVLFTSGSTGVPKGVEVTEQNMLHLLAGADAWHSGTAADVWAGYHAFTFDISMWEVWRPLTQGAELFVLPKVAQLDAELSYSLVTESGISVLCQTPTAARLLANHVSKSGMPAQLRQLLLAGERLDFAELHPFTAAMSAGRLEVWNLYGPTEATIYSTGYCISAADIRTERRSLIGRALPHVAVEVHKPDADGIGELWISGPGVAAGYRGDAELTRQKFGSDSAGRRVYRTGDLVRADATGLLEFVGRAGGFVKVRGFRIEPGEIVTALCAHPTVNEAAVVVTEVLGWGPTVVCAVVTWDAATPSELALRQHAGALLPAYMRPARIIFLTALPRLPSSKLDERALKAAVEARLA